MDYMGIAEADMNRGLAVDTIKRAIDRFDHRIFPGD